MEGINIAGRHIQTLYDLLNSIFVSAGMSGRLAFVLAEMSAIALAFAFVAGLWLLLNRPVVSIVSRFIRFTDNKWDDALLDSRLLHRVVKIVPAAVFSSIIPWVVKGEVLQWTLHTVASVYIVVLSVKIVFSLTKAFDTVSRHKSSYSQKPLLAFLQIVNVAAIFLGGIVAISIIFDKQVGALLTGLGASMAVILLVFKDSILGFVSGWQLSANDLLRVGDWITVPKYGADGDVIEMSLYSVKVRNFDKTITTIPPYALVSDSFQNWRGIQDFGSRRIKRSVLIDIRSVRFCDEKMLKHFASMPTLMDYVSSTQKMLDDMNGSGAGADMERQTNLGIFRAYITRYLINHKDINNSMTCMVRQLQPTEKGLPLEVYCFVSNTDWKYYENVQSDIFDHILAIMPEFGLRVCQYPALEISSNEWMRES